MLIKHANNYKFNVTECFIQLQLKIIPCCVGSSAIPEIGYANPAPFVLHVPCAIVEKLINRIECESGIREKSSLGYFNKRTNFPRPRLTVETGNWNQSDFEYICPNFESVKTYNRQSNFA